MGFEDSVLGDVAPAIIKIIDMRSAPHTMIQKPVEAGGINASNTRFQVVVPEDIFRENPLVENQWNQYADEKRGKELGENKAYVGMTTKEFHVQFNPSSISLDAVGGGNIQKTEYSEEKSSISYGKMNAIINFRVKLIFDQVNSLDAFMWDQMQLSPTKGATQIAKAIKKKNYSVQTEIEGFMAALRDRGTRVISFNWGPLVYAGILNHVSSQYTMFSPSGQPIRGTVDLAIVCADPTVAPGSMGCWKWAYETTFVDNMSFVKSSQKASNFFNFTT